MQGGGEMMRFLVIVAVVLTGVTFPVVQDGAFAQEGSYVSIDQGDSAQSQEAPPASPPSATVDPWPCYFGPITKRITFEDAEAIVLAAPTRREGWYALLAWEENEEIEPRSFTLPASDDGLGDGLVCPAVSQ
jgi:hypothetical protein